MIAQPDRKYAPFAPVALPDRQWPNKVLDSAPIWMSTDLRDGNQSLFEPMNGERKMQLFHMLCQMGFKEIEVAFPAASQIEFDFVRGLIEGKHIPDDVTIEVLTQARAPLIERTMEALRGARRAIVHVYTATSEPFRDMVFTMSKEEVKQMALAAVRQIRTIATTMPETQWVLEYSPETFSATELEFAREICDAVTAEWGATPENKVILNLPATVEMSTPNVYADQIEWMHRHLARRDSIILSLHPHNDRGTAVAAAELGLMAGADRVEGCLFGHGERTGNVDLVTLALNLYSQGVDPQLDFSDINRIARTVESCTQLPVAPRHPYAGDLVFTAFSGSHQDAIKKGFAAQQNKTIWQVPYLPVDPADLGRSYDSVIRVNSQSGKGGIAYLLEQEYGLVLPRRLQVAFSAKVQRHADSQGGEITSQTIWQLFGESYLNQQAPIRYQGHHLFEEGAQQGITLSLTYQGQSHTLKGIGNGPIDATVHALGQLGIQLQVQSYEERSMGKSPHGGDARASAFIEATLVGEGGSKESRYGVGIHENIITASVLSLFSVANGLLI
ncbi:MAG: 2-isopropylmalate synthase [Aeromonadaceae bacterium]